MFLKATYKRFNNQLYNNKNVTKYLGVFSYLRK